MDDTLRSCREFTEVLASDAPAPGGGGAAALTAAIGTALGGMVAALTVGKPRYAAVETELRAVMADCDTLRQQLLAQVQADAEGFLPLAAEKAARFESDPRYAGYCTMMVKTHLSLSHDPTLKGVPTGWRLPVRDVLEYSGARFLCPVAGGISMMPGTGSDPAYRRVDIDTATGEVTGLF